MDQETPTTHRSGRKFDGKSNLIIGLGAVVVILIIVAFANFGGSMFSGKKLSPDEAKAKALEFINKNLVQGTTASISEVTDYSDSLYKLSVVVGTSTIDSYISKDGKQFFPQVMNIDDVNNGTVATGDTTATPAAPVVPADLPKNDKPVVEMFVMSECPYGLQMQKGMLPVVAALKDKMDFQLKFVNYAMHGKKEVDEQLRQYCINKEDNSKLLSYLTCYSKSGSATSCGTEAGVNESKVSSCVAKADKEFKITESYNDKNTWTGSFPSFAIYDAENKKYGVQGSPSLVINGKMVESNRDSQSLLTTICAAFNNAPEACNTALDSATPAPGFGSGVTSNTNAAECAPAT